MAKIKAKDWHGGKLIVVPQKKLTFGYFKRGKKNPRLSGRSFGTRSLEITSNDPKCPTTLKLNGREINTLKKILAAAGEIG